MFDNTTAGITYDKCLYCGNYHSYGPDMCRGLHERQANTMPMIMIPDYKDQLQQIIDLLKEIKDNTDRFRLNGLR